MSSIEKKPLVTDLYTAHPSAHAFNAKIYRSRTYEQDSDGEKNDKGDEYEIKN